MVTDMELDEVEHNLVTPEMPMDTISVPYRIGILQVKEGLEADNRDVVPA